ncbi:hypothetical protein QL285_091163 [Trifolium repens]|nr:hypothetical protein QL285_091163 [Trifolium repens]
MSKKDSYGPPLEESKKAITAKQVLQSSSASTSLSTQNKFTPLTPLALPAFYPSSSPRGIRPSLNSKLVSPLTFALNTPSSLNTPSKIPEKLPFYTPPDSLSCPFMEKDYKKILFLLEPEYNSEGSLLQITSKFFPQGFHYLPSNPEKTRLFYEFILVDTESIDITHTYDKNDKTKIIFSKFKILKILSPSDWKAHPSHTRSFTRRFSPQHYSYYDYMEAWSNMLYYHPFDHSWFIWFRKDFPLKFPLWFVKWFHEWGPENNIYPDYAAKAFEVFSEKINISDHLKILAFHATFGISWITSWTFKKELSVPNSHVFWIIRCIRVKWWNKFNPELINSQILQDWFTKHPRCLIKAPDTNKESEFLAEKSKFLADLSSSSNKKELLKKLQAAISESDVNNDDDSVGSSQSLTHNNEDDCYGILDLQD